jgi:hypothetical protein
MARSRKSNPGADVRERGRKWLDRVETALKAEKHWRDDAQKAVEAYTGEGQSQTAGTGYVSDGQYDFNILFANVETIVPAVINSPPAPDIRRRFGEPDPVAKTVAEIIERAIRVQIDDSRLQVEMEAAAQDAFLAGRGIIRLRFKSDIVGGEPTNKEIENAADRADDVEVERDQSADELYDGRDETSSDDSRDDGQPANVAAPAGFGSTGIGGNGGPPIERVENERVTFEAVSWLDYCHGPAKRWDERPWDAFRFCIPREEEGKSFNSDLIQEQMSAGDWSKRQSSEGELTGWEIWDKDRLQVLFIDDAGIILKEIKDPLGLSGFFPIPTPMQPIDVNGRLMPVNPFSTYRRLANDLDDAVRRKNKLIDAMKAKGWYGISETDMQSVIDLNDNEFAPVKDPELWAQAGGVEKAIAFWPLERFIAAIQQLDAAINTYKQWIYEITGISDIVRGASIANETATAQNIKSQWGSLRIQKMQRMMERCARDLFVMMSEIIPTKFTPQTLEAMTAIPLLPQPNDPPEAIQMKAAVGQLMKQRLSSYYRIDVESDSTVKADLSRQKAEASQFMQAASGYFQAVAPLVQQGAMPADAAVEIFASFSRMFNLGRSVEDTLDQMVSMAKQKAAEPQQGPPPDPAKQALAEKAKAETAKIGMENQSRQQDMQIKAVSAQMDMQERQQDLQIKAEEAARKAEADGIEAQQKAILAVLDEQLKRIQLETAEIAKQAKSLELERQLIPPPTDIHTTTIVAEPMQEPAL